MASWLPARNETITARTSRVMIRPKPNIRRWMMDICGIGIFIGIAYMLRVTWLTVDEDHQYGIFSQLYQEVGECESYFTTLYRGVSLYSNSLILCNVSPFVVIFTPPWCSTKQDLNRVESRLSFRWYFVLQEGSVLGLR
ncbi:hypothetical protein [Aeromonas salmonicida]|uniref:hypothetical protein n=1 Tax=Aeromonas salmonicida TaxID=645 RepID=UPI0021534C44|nr:hypothetical protein [Aeromonas salmonicida]